MSDTFDHESDAIDSYYDGQAECVPPQYAMPKPVIIKTQILTKDEKIEMLVEALKEIEAKSSIFTVQSLREAKRLAQQALKEVVI